MPNSVLTNAEILSLLNDLARDGGPLVELTLRLSSTNIVPTRGMALSALTECVFTGYAPVHGQNPGPAYLGTDGQFHLTYPENTFVGTDGAAQAVTVAARGPITMAGTVTAVVTAAGMTGTPRTVTVTGIATTDTNQDLAEKIAIACAADADVGPFFFVYALGNVVTFERRAALANDATMNVALANGTALGLTAVPTSTPGRAGSAPGAFTPDTAHVAYATDDTGTVLRWAQQLPAPVSFGGVGQGGSAGLDYVYGG